MSALREVDTPPPDERSAGDAAAEERPRQATGPKRPGRPSTPNERERSPRKPAAAWIAALVASVLVAGLLPMLRTPRFYFYGDTQAGAYGQWFHLGQQLLTGRWPVLDLQAWRAGNFIAEGQWGLFSPLTMSVALLSTQVANAVLFVTAVKLALLVTAALGTYLVVRSYAAPPWAGYVAGLAVTLGGATRYLESPSWVTGQMIWALLPLFWWALRRMIVLRANPAPALAFGYLIVTVGYVYGCLYIAVVVIGCLVDAWLTRGRSAALRVLGVGLCCAVLSVTVYLPGLLTAPVTTRAGFEISSDGDLNGSLLGVMTGVLPYPTAGVYVAWFIPMLAWLDLRRVGRLRRSLAGGVVIVALAAAWVLGPNQIGPIRWPGRVMPLLVLTSVVIICVLISRARLRPVSVGRLAASLVWACAAGWLVVSRRLDSSGAILICLLTVLIGLAVAWLLLRPDVWRAPPTEKAHRTSRRLATRTSVLGLFIGTWSIAVVAVQYSYFPQPPSVDRNMPANQSGYATQASAARGDVMVVGNAEKAVIADPAATQDFLIASSWFLSPQTVQSAYSTIGFRAYNSRYCIRYNGTTLCPETLARLLSRERRTKMRRVDLLSISTLQIFRPDFPDKRLLNPPSGWRVRHQSRYAVTWVRNQPLPTAGGVTWSSPGLKVSTISADTRRLILRVDEVPSDGGTLVLSRLAWPGYRTTGASLDAPTDDYLLTIKVPASARNGTVTVEYDPPGWFVEQLALVVALGAAIGWSLWCLVWSRWLRRRDGSTHFASDPNKRSGPKSA